MATMTMATVVIAVILAIAARMATSPAAKVTAKALRTPASIAMVAMASTPTTMDTEARYIPVRHVPQFYPT